jgi:hypothetical protein
VNIVMSHLVIKCLEILEKLHNWRLHKKAPALWGCNWSVFWMGTTLPLACYEGSYILNSFFTFLLLEGYI